MQLSLYTNAHDSATQPCLVQQIDASQFKSCVSCIFLMWKPCKKKKPYLPLGKKTQNGLCTPGGLLQTWQHLTNEPSDNYLIDRFFHGFRRSCGFSCFKSQDSQLVKMVVRWGCSWSRSFGMIGCWPEAFWPCLGKLGWDGFMIWYLEKEVYFFGSNYNYDEYIFFRFWDFFLEFCFPASLLVCFPKIPLLCFSASCCSAFLHLCFPCFCAFQA